MSKQRRTIALDFDGVLHKYDGYRNGFIDEPIEGAKEAVAALQKAGHTVVIFSTRDKALITDWLKRYGFPELEVTSIKRPFYVMVDDRAVRFDGVWSKEMVKQVRDFEPYWIKARRAVRTSPQG